jgi:ABC-type multidrug transport system ATPase subunit
MTDLVDDGMAMTVVTHAMGFAERLAARIVFIDGKVVEDCPKVEFSTTLNQGRIALPVFSEKSFRIGSGLLINAGFRLKAVLLNSN